MQLELRPDRPGTHNAHALVAGAVVLVAGLLERIGAIVAGQPAGQGDQHLAQRRMHVEEERPVDVPAAHFAEVRLVPAHVIRLRDIVEAGGQRQGADGAEPQPHVPLVRLAGVGGGGGRTLRLACGRLRVLGSAGGRAAAVVTVGAVLGVLCQAGHVVVVGGGGGEVRPQMRVRRADVHSACGAAD